jgi:beta-arabinofuranosyltransferase
MLFGSYRERRPPPGGDAGRVERTRRDNVGGSDRASAKYTRGRRGKRAKHLSDKIDLWLVLLAFTVVACRAFTLARQKLHFPSLADGDRRAYGIALHPADAAAVEDLCGRLATLSIEIFSAPKPFVGADRDSNRRAIESWLRLRPTPKVTLLGDEVGYAEAARDYRLRLDRGVDKTFLGLPLFNSMIDRANRSDADIAVVINGDIQLTDDFMQTMRKVSATVRNYLVIAARYDVDSIPTNRTADAEAVRNHVVDNGRLHTYGGMDLWAWNTDGPRLYGPEMPHFIFGRGKYDNWMTHEAIAAGHREVIDATETALLVHVRHDYHLVAGNGGVRPGRALLSKQFWSEGKRSKFELFINIYLSLHVGTYVNQMGSVLYAPWKLGRCAEPTGMCLTRRKRPGMCPCEYSGFTAATQTDPAVKDGSRVIRCGMLSAETKDSFTIPVLPPRGENVEPESFGMPLTVRAVTEKVAQNNTVFLTALTYGYRSMMMSWVCNLRELEITNYVIAALDEELYRYAFTRGLPTYFEDQATSGRHDGVSTDAAYGSPSFKQITKAKSRVVVRLLQLGYNVLWSDCDVTLFRNPLVDMWGRNADLVIQSNAPDNEPGNGGRRLNSGFYLAASSPHLIAAFEDIVDYARRSAMSEQPCFYDVLCGKDGGNAVGTDACQYKKVSVKVLPRELYPNGVTNNIWSVEDGRILDRFPGLYVLHNNWLRGTAGKHDRLRRHGMVTFDPQTELCTFDSIVARARAVPLAPPA